MSLAALLFFASSALTPASNTAQATTCPWVTLGSAAAALGGDPAPTVQLSGKAKGQGYCTFTFADVASKQTLKIVVGKAADNPCSAGGTALTGIGNEATMCTTRRSSEEVMETIVSRVRDLHFTVSISVRRKGSKNAPVGHYDDGVRMIAEQVAGNLF